MKIGHLDTNLTNANATRPDRKVSSGEAVGGLEPSAKVELSSAAGTSLEGPDEASFDQAKVDRIASAIREGRFQVDAGAIADKLITNAQELLTRSNR
jgi:negative regulator of flagellin synthesis FlgM